MEDFVHVSGTQNITFRNYSDDTWDAIVTTDQFLNELYKADDSDAVQSVIKTYMKAKKQ